jgi:hypothetical protein
MDNPLLQLNQALQVAGRVPRHAGLEVEHDQHEHER